MGEQHDSSASVGAAIGAFVWFAVLAPAAVHAQSEDDIFQDGFETGSLCRWSSEPDCTCIDSYEPNESEVTAADLGTLADCDENLLSVSAVLADGEDTDFFTYQGSTRLSVTSVQA